MIKMKTIRRGKVPPAILLLSSKLLLSSNEAGGTFPLLIVFVLFSACVCRRPSWTPKTQPGGSCWVFGVQLDYSCHKKRGVDRSVPRWFIITSLWSPNENVLEIHKLLVAVSAERQVGHHNLGQTGALRLFGWVIGIQFDSQANECSPDTENHVRVLCGCKETF